MSIASIPDTQLRELDHRVNAGLEVTLFWDAGDNSTSIDLYYTATDETIRFRVAPDRALDAFRHPFAHLKELDSRRPLDLRLNA